MTDEPTFFAGMAGCVGFDSPKCMTENTFAPQFSVLVAATDIPESHKILHLYYVSQRF